jgi:phosphate starvation-inducible protein PhoH
VYFTEKDVVRHELVQEIIQAYEQAERNNQGKTHAPPR